MSTPHGFSASTVAIILILAQPASHTRAGETADPHKGVVHVGLMQTLFRDLPDPLVHALLEPFGALFRAETGHDAYVVRDADALRLGRLLNEDQLQLGVFQGIEFAWARQKYPELQPLMIVFNQKKHLRACLLTRADTAITEWADLKGQSLALPCRSHQHCYEFLNRHCRQQHQEPEQFLGKIIKPANVEEALDDLVEAR